MNKLLALNIIAGPGDDRILHRLFASFDYRAAFDEVVICLTTNDNNVREAAKAYSNKTVYWPWHTDRYPHGDFGGARNAALDVTTADYWMWLDTDDVFNGDTRRAFAKTREVLKNNKRDVWAMPYVLATDEFNVSTDEIQRERIIRRESGIRWQHPVHEQLTFHSKFNSVGELRGLSVFHAPIKPSELGASRNVQILLNEYHHTPDDHSSFYLGRDLYKAGEKEGAVSLLTNYINNYHEGSVNVYGAALLLAQFFSYARDGSQMVLRHLDLGERFARIATEANPAAAEPWVILGDIYGICGKNEQAIVYYKRALGCKYGAAGIQTKEFYDAVPKCRIAQSYEVLDKMEQAIYWNRLAIDATGGDPALIKQRARISNAIANSTQVMLDGISR